VGYDHHTVNHSKEFKTEEGVCTNPIEGSFKQLRGMTPSTSKGNDLNYRHSRRSWSVNRGLRPREGFWKYVATVGQVYDPNRGHDHILEDHHFSSPLLCTPHTPAGYGRPKSVRDQIITRSARDMVDDLEEEGEEEVGGEPPVVGGEKEDQSSFDEEEEEKEP